MAATHDKLNPQSGGSALRRESHQEKTPTVPAAGVFLFSAVALNLPEPPLRFGDDAID